MDLVGPLLRMTLKPLASYLNQPNASFAPAVPTDLEVLARVLLPGDVILVEGNTRFASLVRVLTQSTWSHVAMFVGPLDDRPDPACLVEADVEQGVRTIPLSELRGMSARVVRATGLTAQERAQVARRVLARVGQRYDVDYAIGLARTLWPIGRGRARQELTPVAAAERAICSTLLAQAFEEVGYPVLSRPAGACVYTPRDFDLSPYFGVVAAPLARATRLQPEAVLRATLPPVQPAPVPIRAPVSTRI
jgi:hypothetical protein